MTHLLIWMLTFPVVTSATRLMDHRISSLSEDGHRRRSQVEAATYFLGILIFLGLIYV